MKTACVIQGNLRDGFELVLHEMQKHFDIVIISTWEEESKKIPDGDFITVLSKKPEIAGYSNRNYQRYSTAKGIAKAKELGCDYVLKWRTDMLPTKLNIDQLIKWANVDLHDKLPSRIVTCTFRNLTVREDWFSSIPDLFAFGHIELMEMLWGDNEFDYSKMMNPPKQMIADEGDDWLLRNEISGYWCAESELYAIFKDRLQKKLNTKLSHETIAKNYMRLIDHHRLGIVWFGPNHTFRSIYQAWQHPWWNERIWKYAHPTYVQKGYILQTKIQRIKEKLSIVAIQYEIFIQQKYLKDYLK